MSISPLQDAADLIKEGNVAEAIHLLQRLTEVLPGYAAAYVLLAHALEANGQPRPALSAWQHAALLIPNSQVIQNGLIRTADAHLAKPSEEPISLQETVSAENQNEKISENPTFPELERALEQEESPVIEPPKTTSQTAVSLEDKEGILKTSQLSSNTTRDTSTDSPIESQPTWHWPEALIEASQKQDETAKTHQKADPKPSTLDVTDDDSSVTPPTDASSDLELGEQSETTPAPVPNGINSQNETLQETALADAVAPEHDEAGAEDNIEAQPPTLPGGADWFDDLDSLITELETARIVPKPDFESVPPPSLEDDIEDVVSETLARIYASQKQYEEAARVYEQLAEQHPDQAPTFLEKAADMRAQ